jgi:hypothetical protein
LGDDGEVGEVGEYFGEAGVISAGAEGQVSKRLIPERQFATWLTHTLRILENEEK